MINKNSPIFKALYSMSSPIDAERDYIECQILDTLFADEAISDKLVFAGGATLCKSYNLCHRISHDLDFACTEFNEPLQNRSRRQLQNFKNKFKEYVFDQLCARIQYAINQDLRFMIATDRQWRTLHNPEQGTSYPILHVLYKSSLDNSVQRICLEIMPRKYKSSAILLQTAVPYAINAPTRKIPTVTYVQTFWDKIFALHCLATNTSTRARDFYSRHYFDVAQLADKIDVNDTFHMFQDTVLYQTIYTTKDIPQISCPAAIRIVPNDTLLHKLEIDYHANKDQFIGQLQPKWDSIVQRLTQFNAHLANLNNKR